MRPILITALLATGCKGDLDVTYACPLDVPDAEVADIDDACSVPLGGGGVSDPWDIGIEWQWLGHPLDDDLHNVAGSPVVGHLDDDDGNGVVDGHDTPDIVFVAYDSVMQSTTLMVLDGATGAEKLTRAGVARNADPVLADVDGDGATDIVVLDTQYAPMALTADGREIWTSPVAGSAWTQGLIVADLDGDGSPEIVFDDVVLEGDTGALRAELPHLLGNIFTRPTVGDIDLDGRQEIIVANRAWESDGSPEWELDFRPLHSVYSVIVDVDGDPEGEVVLYGDDRMFVLDHDGEILEQIPRGRPPESPYDSPACVADFDGDGAAELGWIENYDQLVLRELNGEELWSLPVEQVVGLPACLGYDFDNDGTYEVVLSHFDALDVLEGATGDVLFTYADMSSGGQWSHPAVADVDNDGSAELVVGSTHMSYTDRGWGGLTVFGQVDGTWLKGGSTWPSYDFVPTPTGPGAPLEAVAWWQDLNVKHARPAAMPGWGVDLEAEVHDLCATGCEPGDRVVVSVTVANRGVLTAPGDIPVTLFREGPDGRSIHLETQYIADGLESGAVESVVFTASFEDLAAGRFSIAAGGDVGDCDLADNIARWRGTMCPEDTGGAE